MELYDWYIIFKIILFVKKNTVLDNTFSKIRNVVYLMEIK